MKVGDQVRTAVTLPGIPAGTSGLVSEVGRLFVVVAFDDGRHGYYVRRQLESAIACHADDLSPVPSLVSLGLDGARIPRGSHGCLLPCHEAVAVITVARYLGAGLAAGETVVCWFPRTWQGRFFRCLRHLNVDGELASRSNRLSILHPSGVYLGRREFTAEKQLERTAAAVSALVKDSPAAVRCFGHIGRRSTMEGWWDYEAAFTPIARALGVTTLCGYPDFGSRDDGPRLAADTHTFLIGNGRLMAGNQAVAGA